MARVTKKYLEGRVQRFGRVAKDLGVVKKDQEVYLSCYNPGDGVRYQVQVLNKGSAGEVKSFPNFHMLTREFDRYLDGLIDALESVYWK